MEQLQSHIWLTASSYMGKFLRISSFMRKPLLIYDFATAPLWISLFIRNFFFISVASAYSAQAQSIVALNADFSAGLHYMPLAFIAFGCTPEALCALLYQVADRQRFVAYPYPSFYIFLLT